MPADESSDAEVLIEWAERVVADEDDRVDDECEEAMQHDIDAAIVEIGMLRREVDQVDQITPQQRHERAAALDAGLADLERTLRNLGGDPR